MLGINIGLVCISLYIKKKVSFFRLCDAIFKGELQFFLLNVVNLFIQTGKTFLYNGLYHKLLRKTACVAWTGIASIPLPCGTTSHRFFNLAIKLTHEGICFTKPRDNCCLQEVNVKIL